MDDPPEPSLTRGAASAVAGGFLALIAAVAVYDGAALDGLQLPAPDSAELVSGRYTAALEDELEEHSPAGALLRPPWAALLLETLGRANDQVVAGRDGWLYLADTVRLPFDHREREAVNLAHVEAGVLALRRAGVDCVVVLVPNKVSVNPGQLPPGAARSMPRPPRYRELRAWLTERGLWVPDVLGFMRARRDLVFYRRDDTHWSQEGLQRVAEYIALTILPRYPELRPRVHFPPTVRESPRPEGDLLRLLGLPPGGDLERSYRSPEVARFLLQQPLEGPAELYVSGTSMSGRGFKDFLPQELGTAARTLNRDGEGPSLGLALILDALRTETGPPPRLVIWEFVERMLWDPPRRAFQPLAHALSRHYAGAYSELAALPPPEPGSLAWPALGWVLPGNGTTALELETRFPETARLFAAGSLEAYEDQEDETCDAVISVWRTQVGDLDPSYGEGGVANGVQVRTVSVLSGP